MTQLPLTPRGASASRWWPLEYSRSFLRLDVIAGLTTAAVVIPQALAYAGIAGLPPSVGLYTAVFPMVAYALLGTSRPLSVSTTSTVAIMCAGLLAATVPAGDPAGLIAASSTLACLVGAFLLLSGILRMGFIANFLSIPVLAGFKAGIGLVILLNQIPKLLGIHVEKGNFLASLLSLARHLPEAGAATVILGIGAVTLVLALQKYARRVPAPLVVAILGIAAAAIFDLRGQGVELTGTVQGGMPSPAWPNLSLATQLWPGALAIALMVFTESIAAAKTFARHGDPRPNADRELLALGGANLIGCLFGIMPASGGTSQTAVNLRSGARTQAAEIVTALLGLAALLFLGPVIGLLPKTVLAAVVIAAILPLLNPVGFRAILRVRAEEFVWALAALAGVVVFGMLWGILLAVAISMLTLFYLANHPPVYVLAYNRSEDVFRPLGESPDDVTLPGVLILRTEGRMHFASAPRPAEKMRALVDEWHPRVLVLDCRAIPDFEYTALTMMLEAEQTLRERGITLRLAGLNPGARKVIERSPLGAALGPDRIFGTVREAVSDTLCAKLAARGISGFPNAKVTIAEE
ncbi:MAG: SulP family inorganic anion transporter [Candidatus Brocadiia bacterium]